MKRRLFSLVLALIMVLCLTPVHLYAAEGEATTSTVDSGTCGENLTWTFDDQGTLTISGTGDMADYTYNNKAPWVSHYTAITKVVVQNGVTGIGDWAFNGYWNTVSVTLPDSLERVGKYAFQNCTKLVDISIPAGVTSLGEYAFAYCSAMPSVILPSGLTRLERSVFRDCRAMTAVTIPEGVTSIGANAFAYCDKLTDVTIPGSVTSIGEYAFSYCKSLRFVEIPASVTDIGNYAFQYCENLACVTIPDSVTNIGNNAFMSCKVLNSVFFLGDAPRFGTNCFSGVTLNAFYPSSNGTWTDAKKQNYGGTVTWRSHVDGLVGSGDCSVNNNGSVTWTLRYRKLTVSGTGAMRAYSGSNYVPWNNYKSIIDTVVIENGVTSIGDYSFDGCTNLTSVWMGADVASIGKYAFRGSKMTEVTIPEGVTDIGYGAFYGCTRLQSVSIPGAVTSLGEDAFYNCTALEEVVMGEGLQRIGRYAFSNCTALRCVTIPSTVNVIDRYAFCNCKALKNITIPGSVTEIGQRAFANSGLTELTIPEGVISIGESAFNNCTALQHVSIPASVSEIGSAVFQGCSALISISVAADNEAFSCIDDVLLIDRGTTALAFCPAEQTEVTVPEGVTSIGEDCFYRCTGLTSISLPASLTDIGSSAFSGCTGLTSISLPASLTDIGSYAFFGCTGLTSISLPASLTGIGSYAFSGCSGLTDVYFSGTDVQWDAVTKSGGNDPLTGAQVHTVGHTYGEPTWTWNEDHTQASAVFTCLREDDTQTVEAEITVTETPVTCTEDGYFDYTATVVFEGQTYTDQQSVIAQPATGHHFGGEPEWEWNEDLTEAHAIFHCADCDAVDSVLAESVDYDRQEPTHVRDGYISATVVAVYGGQEYYKYEELVLFALGHTYGEPTWTWSEDHTANAAFTCSCGHVLTVPAEITYNDDQPATHYETGLRTYTATVTLDGAVYTDQTTAILPLTPHEYETVWTWSEDYGTASVRLTCVYGDDERQLEADVRMERIDATAEADGAFVYIASVTLEGVEYSDEQRVTIHFYGDPVWSWSEDHSAATATFTCVNCGDEQTVEAAVSAETTEPTHTRDGESVYTATVTFEGETYTDVQHVTLPALGHTYGDPEWIWAEDGSSARAVFRCVDGDDQQELDATVTQTRRVEPTCTESGSIKYLGSVMFLGQRYTNNYTVILPALGHAYGTPEWSWSEDHSAATATFTCANCGDEQTVEAVVSAETTEPTHTRDGETVYTAAATFEDETYIETYTEIHPALGHTYGTPEWIWAEDGSSARVVFRCEGGDDQQELEAAVTQGRRVEATCTESGSIKYIGSVMFLGQRYTNTYTAILPALGHAYGAPEWSWSEDHSAATAAFTCANCGDEQTVEAAVSAETTEPTHTRDGELVYTAAVTFEGETYIETYTEILPALGHTYGAPEWSWSEDHSAAEATFTCTCGDKQTVEANVTVTTTEPTYTESGEKVYTAVVTFEGETYTDSFTEKLPIPLLILTQPEDFTGLLNSTATFRVEAVGEGLTYMWQTWSGSKWINTSFAGSKTDTLIMSITAVRDGRQYRCVITDACGDSVESEVVKLHVAAPTIVITSQPEDFSGPLNGTATFHVGATGEGLSYMWQTYTGTKWVNTNFASSKKDTLTMSITAVRDNKQYRCLITDANGCTVETEVVTLHVTAPTIVITSQPEDVTGPLNGTAIFHVEATGEGLTYMWQTWNGSKWINTNFAGSKKDTLTMSITNVRDGRQYRCVITDADGNSVASNPATLHVG